MKIISELLRLWTWTFAVTVLVKTRLRVSWERIFIHLVHAQSKLFRSRNSLSQPNLSNVNGNVFYIPHIIIYGSWRFTLLFSVGARTVIVTGNSQEPYFAYFL